MVTHSLTLGSAFNHLADDTEETLGGSSMHWDAIVEAYQSLRRHRRRFDLPWFIGDQFKMVIPREGGRPPYQPSPDLLVHPTLGTGDRASLSVAREGPPALVIEVVSPATGLSNDLRLDYPAGKPMAYAAIGVNEYLTFDPLGDIIPEQIRAWRLGPANVYIPWEADSAWRWVSDLGVSFAPQGLRLRVFDAEGEAIPRYEELDDLVDDLTGTVAAQERELAEMREALRRARGEG